MCLATGSDHVSLGLFESDTRWFEYSSSTVHALVKNKVVFFVDSNFNA